MKKVPSEWQMSQRVKAEKVAGALGAQALRRQHYFPSPAVRRTSEPDASDAFVMFFSSFLKPTTEHLLDHYDAQTAI
ncbi:BZ3500_MvSof-1268-A1-R1_Chr9g10810 [Microbotryum saponariae]|uniref:BZ3500_MvSof-1268-A1-R1_Chr9g10810 protein n=1 Tax=Microbotryum saponariae TaxID=289078 RepID=A0A2X0KDB3_9BASI|nr:BZ3501_MvSof-1269-A2-R1_Chr9g10558 [Microbotryum saponariae]SDA00733.1 BZ3500_MvSof-1268-A1-R1_Chr9g10810 [Microbotryum saponariae]